MSSRYGSSRFWNDSPVSKKPLPFVSVNDSSPIAVASIVVRPAALTGGVSSPGIGLGFALVQVTLHVPSPGVGPGVAQLPTMCPPSVVKATAVPSGAGLLYRSARRTTIGMVTPSILKASTFGQALPELPVPVAIEKPVEAGKPVDTASTFELVDSAGEAIVADTTTEVCTVPELTMVCTVPSDPEVAEDCDNASPPTVVFNPNVTSTPERGPPLESTTLKMTVDVSLSPVPLRPIVAGVAETNWIDPTAAWAIVMVPVAAKFDVVPFEPVTVAVAVMTSEGLQPFAV